MNLEKAGARASTDVAVIGMSGRFPGADSLDEFWEIIEEGTDAISWFAPGELLRAGVEPAWIDAPGYVPAAGVLRDVESFDAEFFGLTPREAQTLDPQQRLFMECAWHAIEDAGYDPARNPARVGVYAGCLMSSYYFELCRNPAVLGRLGYLPALIGNDKDYLATRIAYAFGLTGPAITVQTACSTGLVAVCEAYHALVEGRCDVALAGAVSVRVPHRAGYFYSPDGIYSPDGHCRPFDVDARGTVFGNGVGVVVLKRAPDAIADKDLVRAWLRGAAVNNDGSDKVGYTAPSQHGQTAAIMRAYSACGVSPTTVDYVETHGTATRLGDPIEIRALREAFGAAGMRDRSCALGAVKANIGHLDTAAGIAGFIKVVLALEHQVLPPLANFRSPNLELELEQTPFYIPTAAQAWARSDHPRRAAVSAFGVGGTNAHAVLEERPAAAHLQGPDATDIGLPAVLTLSAATPSALAQVAADLGDHLDRAKSDTTADCAFTLQVGRRPLRFRRALVCPSRHEAVHALRLLADETASPLAPEAHARAVVWAFAGQGAQYPGMGAGLYERVGCYRRVIDQCAEILGNVAGLDLHALLAAAGPGSGAEALARGDTAASQPALFAVEYALARTWEHWGLGADAMLGHSVGEYVAACVAGVFTLPDALALIVARGQLMQAQPPGAMLAVPLPEHDVLELLDQTCSVAAINDATVTIVAGPLDRITALEARLARRQLHTARLRTSHAFHSPMMEPVVAPLRALATSVQLQAPKVPFVSNVTGTWINDVQATDPAYWAVHARRPVRFADGVQTILDHFDGRSAVIELGPGRTLTNLVRRQSGPRADLVAQSSLPEHGDRLADHEHIAHALGDLWASGAREIDWPAVHEDSPPRRVRLPGYPFARTRHWVDAPAPAPMRREKLADLTDWLGAPRWSQAPPLTNGSPVSAQRWLVFADGDALGERLLMALRASGGSVVVVRPGKRFARTGAGEFSVAPLAAQDYERLLRETGRPPRRLLHTWLLGRCVRCAPDEFETPAHAIGAMFGGLANCGAASVDVVLLSGAAFSVDGECGSQPEKAAALALAKVASQELPVTCRVIDLPGEIEPDGDLDWQCRTVLAELCGSDGAAPCAYRRSARWTQTLEPCRLPAPPTPRRLRERGVYLVSGGLGGIGLAIARYLATTVRARLVLVGRSPLPPRCDWLDTIEAGDDALLRRVRTLAEINRLGGEAEVVAADVSDPAQAARAVDVAQAHFGGLDGVIHAAGVAGGQILAMRRLDTAARVLVPKLRGTVNLHRATEALQLDFFALCSSLTSLVGGAGQADYCVANAFLDAWAHARRADGHHCYQVINWDTWQEVGMAVDTPVPARLRPFRDQALRLGMTSAQGTEIFARVIESDETQIAVSTTGAALLGPMSQPERSAESARSTTAASRPHTGRPHVTPSTETEKRIAAMWEELLGIGGLSADDEFFNDLGGHSLLATQVLSRIRDVFGVELTLRAFFDAPSISRLARQVASAGDGSAAATPPRLARVSRSRYRLSAAQEVVPR